MSQEQQPTKNPYSMPLKELAAVLVKHYGLHEGYYETEMSFQLAVGPSPVPGQEGMPALITAVSSVGIKKLDEKTDGSVDASEINPKQGESDAKRRTKTK